MKKKILNSRSFVEVNRKFSGRKLEVFWEFIGCYLVAKHVINLYEVTTNYIKRLNMVLEFDIKTAFIS